MSAAAPLLLILAALVAIPFGIIALIYLIVPVFRAIGWLVRQVVRFAFGMISDTLRAVGAGITMLALVPLVIGNVALGRWSASAHFGRAIQGEAHAALRCVYRVLVGHPARLLCLTSLTEGLEKRIPEAVAAAPGADRPRGRANQFEGYTIVGSLPGGGSGSKLYVADPGRQKLAAFERAGQGDVDQVVIKSFSLREGSSLPQIVRESRALDAAKRLGLILEHELTADRFYYVMKYVPGDSLGLVTQRLHAASTSEGLGERELRETVEYGCDLLRTLCHYHSGGLWHKDVKPDNIIVAHGQAHLVDFGLVTPLRSAMTLTTHGTEYFRDPEMVRMALKGVKVHEVDGAKFDIYAAGAVLYSVVENSFPAHGGLSQISRRCPEALRWIVRRAMTDYDKRYETAEAMLADMEAVLASRDMFAMKPAALPSVGGSVLEPEPAFAVHEAAFAGAPAAAAAAAAGDDASFDATWDRIGRSAGQEFRTKTGLAFTYRCDGRACYPSRTNYVLSREDFRTAFGMMPVPGPAALNDVVRGPAYIWAILHDPRIAPDAAPAPRPSPAFAAAASPAPFMPPPRPASPEPTSGDRLRPNIRVTSWWSGRYAVDGAPARPGAFAPPHAPMPPVPPAPPKPPFVRRSGNAKAAEQLEAARRRVHTARARARDRMHRRDHKHASGINGGVAAALFAFLAVAVGLGALIIALASDRGSSPSVVVESARERAATRLADAADGLAAHARDLESRVRAQHVSAPVPPLPPVPPAFDAAPGSMGQILVMREPFTLGSEVATLVNGQLARLREAGFELVGSSDLPPADADEQARQDALVADLRAAVGVVPFLSPDASERIRQWLSAHEDLPIVLWIGRGEGDTPQAWVVGRDRVDPRLPALAHEALLVRK